MTLYRLPHVDKSRYIALRQTSVTHEGCHVETLRAWHTDEETVVESITLWTPETDQGTDDTFESAVSE